jgi:hypothetical protein
VELFEDMCFDTSSVECAATNEAEVVMYRRVIGQRDILFSGFFVGTGQVAACAFRTCFGIA